MIPSEPALSDDAAALQAMLAAERLENERLRKIIRELQRHRFGRVITQGVQTGAGQGVRVGGDV